MSERITVGTSLIEPIYSQTDPSQPIDLGSVPIQFEHKGTTRHSTAKVTIKFVPHDRLEFVCPLEGESPMFGLRFLPDIGSDVELTLTERGITFDAFYTAVGGDYGGIVFQPARSAVVVTAPSNAISTATFHLFNFPDFFGPENYILMTGSPPLQGMKGCGRVVLKADGWNITVAATEQTDRLTKALKAQGGYVLTHMGRIAREDGPTFSSEQLEDLLSCLQYFFSFALGRWAGVALPIGFDADGNRVYEQWGMARTADGAWDGSQQFPAAQNSR